MTTKKFSDSFKDFFFDQGFREGVRIKELIHQIPEEKLRRHFRALELAQSELPLEEAYGEGYTVGFLTPAQGGRHG